MRGQAEFQPAHYPDLKDKVVFVTGGASGIGAAMTAAFAQQGCRVAFADILEEEGRALAASLADAVGRPPLFLHCDVSDVACLQEAFAIVSAKLGPSQVLVNNAANDSRHGLDDLTVELWEERMALNLRAVVFASRIAAEQMKRAGGGAILNFGSIAWKLKMADMIAYTTAKAAIHGATRVLARALGPDHIRVVTITPGWVMTERQKRLWLTPESEAALTTGQCLDIRIEPRHVAALALFLASDSAAACTAQEFVIDAGWS